MPAKTNAAKAITQALVKAAPGLDASTVATMSKLIVQNGVPSITKMEPTPISKASRKAVKPARVPKMGKTELIVLSLLGHPGEWFHILTSKKRRSDFGLSGLGKAFEMTTRSVSGGIAHYARFNGDMNLLSPKGKDFITKMNEKLNEIRTGVQAGAFSAKPTSKTNRVTTGSLSHASKYPLNDEESQFLLLVSMPNKKILMTADTSSNEIWHGFRWKWQSRYGFDLSQCTFSQEKQPNGLFNLYGVYTPNSRGEMNSGLREFIEFLKSKPTTEQKAQTKKRFGII